MGEPTPNYREAGHLLSAYGQRLGMEGDDAGAQQALTMAMAIAKHEGDLTLEMETLLDAAWVDLFHLRLQESGEKGLGAIELMERLDDPVRGKDAVIHVLRVHYNSGDMVGAWRYTTLFQAIVENIGDPVLIAGGFYALEKMAAFDGDWTSARQFCERGLIQYAEHEYLLQVRAVLEYRVGDFKQGEAFLDRLIEVYRATGPEPGSTWVHIALLQTISAVAQMTGTTKYFDVGQEAGATVLKSKRVSPLWVWFARTGLALLAAQVGDTRTVQEHYQAVRGQRGNFMTMDVDRLLGILAAASGELDEAAAYFEAALATWGKGSYPEYAWTAYEYADLLLRRGNQEDQARASRLLDDALRISRGLGMAPLTERTLLQKQSVNMQ